MTATGTARIPLDPPRTWFLRLAEWYSRRTYGAVLAPGAAMAHNPRVLISTVRHERSIAGWNRLDPTLEGLAVMASAATIGCSWPIEGPGKVARFVAAVASQGFAIPGVRVGITDINGAAGVVAWSDTEPLMALSLMVVDGVVEQVLIVRNPDKLSGLQLR